MTVNFNLQPPPQGKYATQAQAQAALILAQARSQSQPQDQAQVQVQTGTQKQVSMRDQDEHVKTTITTPTTTLDDGPDADEPHRPLVPMRKIIQIEGRRRDDLALNPNNLDPSDHPASTSTMTSVTGRKRSQPNPNTTSHSHSLSGVGMGTTAGPDKMDGLTRELYALIGDNAPSLAQVRAELAASASGSGSGSGVGRWGDKGGKKREVRRWRQTPFTPSNRSTPLVLRHWKPVPPPAPIIQADPNHPKGSQAQLQDDGKSGVDQTTIATTTQEPDPFEVFGREGNGPNVMTYSQTEYEAWLTDERWTPHETNYLFSLLKTYDLRFLVVTDRYAYVPPGGKTGQDAFDGIYAWPSLVGTGKNAQGGKRKGNKEAKEAGMSAEHVRRSSRREGTLGVTTPGGRAVTPLAPTSSFHSNAPVLPVETDVKTRSMEEIKDRYYTVCRRLLRNRPAVDETLKEKMVKAFDYDIHREVARKKYANSLFHLSRPQMLEEEALYVELKRMEQTERRYRSDREELMRVMGGLDSGILVPGEQGNRAFGRGEAIGIGLARGADGSVLADKLKKRRRGEDGEPAQDVDMPPPPPVKKKVDPMFDERNNITRVPPQPGQLTTSRNTHQPAYLRSTRLPTPKPHLATKTNALLAQLSISTVRLVMPTRDNVVALEKVIHSAEGLVEMKRLVDRVEVEVRTLKAQRDGIVPAISAGLPSVPTEPDSTAVATPALVASGGQEDSTPKSENGPEAAPKSQRAAQRSASVVSSTASELKKKK